MASFAEGRSIEQVLAIARDFAASTPSLSSVSSAKPSVAKAIAADKVADIKAGDAFYICNLKGGGYVIVSSDDRFKPVLGYSSNGSISETTALPDGLRYWLGFLSDEMASAKANGYEKTAEPSLNLCAAMPQKSVEPMLTTKWGQEKPFNGKVIPTAPTGCVATGIAQVMKYWNYPVQGQGSHTNAFNPSQQADFGATTYDWANMLNVYNTGWESKAELDAVQTLMSHIGIATDMRYNFQNSNTSATSNVYGAAALVKYFKYNKYMYVQSRDVVSYGAWKDIVLNELQSGRPVCYTGQDKNIGGHFFVCDGYDALTGKFHFNWGWTGNLDGYYELSALEPGEGGTGAGSGKFTYLQQIFVMMQPTEAGEPTSQFIAETINITTDGKSINIVTKGLENDNTDFSGTCGIAVYDNARNLVAYLVSQEMTMGTGHIHDQEDNFTVDASSLPEGNYQICFATRRNDTPDKAFTVYAHYKNVTFYDAKVSSNGITVSSHTLSSNLAAETPVIVSDEDNTLYQNAMSHFKVTVTNNSTDDFNDEIGILLVKGRNISSSISNNTVIKAGETKTVDVYGVFSDKIVKGTGYTAYPIYYKDGSSLQFEGTAPLSSVVVSDKPSGIESVRIDTKEADIYHNLSGQRVNASAKGIVIQNGKKMIK